MDYQIRDRETMDSLVCIVLESDLTAQWEGLSIDNHFKQNS